MKSVHKGEKPFSCDMKFGQKSDLIRHVKIIHQKVKLFSCGDCGQKFGLNGHLTHQVKTVHLERNNSHEVTVERSFVNIGLSFVM